MLITPCFSSLGCPDATIEQLCAIATRPENRLEGSPACVEIRSLEGTADYPARLAESPHALRHAAAAVKEAGVEVRLIGSSFHLTGHTSANFATTLLGAGRVADALGARYVRVFGGGSGGKPMTDEQIRHSAALYCEAVRYYESEGVAAEIIVETHGSFVTSELVQQMCDEAGQAIPLLWDTHHTWKIGGEDPVETFDVLLPLIRHMHGKDSVALPADVLSSNPYRYVYPGEGEFPIAELFSAMAEATQDAGTASAIPTVAFSLEWELMWHRELPPLEPALQSWLRVLQPYMQATAAAS
ncbi:MAG: sugar phosphate isomerase/epimerase family protein [Candidatus Methylacidiphilales bacterium]|nr:TIM barrel protein [Candidatus Methylacidiphilales bacterium]